MSHRQPISRVRFFVATAVVTALAPSVASAQIPLAGFLVEHVSIRQSLEDKNTINEPAHLTLTFPDGDRSTKDVAAAATIYLRPTESDASFNAGIGLQFTENSAPSDRANLFVGAGELEWVGGKPNQQVGTFSRIRGIAGYKRNGEKHTAGFTASGLWTLESLPDENQEEPAGGLRWTRFLEMTPVGGVEYDNTVAAEDTADEGHVLRLLAGLKGNLYPLADTVGKRVILSAEAAYRRDVETTFEGDRDHAYAAFGFAVALDRDEIFLIGLDRVVGDDPSQDFDGPAFWRVALKVHFAKPQKRAIVFRNSAKLVR